MKPLPALRELPPRFHSYRSLGLPFHKERCGKWGCGQDYDHADHQIPPHIFAWAGPDELCCCGQHRDAAIHGPTP